MNWGSILSQAKSAMKKPSRVKEAERLTQNYIINGGKLANGKSRQPLAKAGEKFIDVLKYVLQQQAGENFASGELGTTAISAASDLSANTPYKSGDRYYIDINFNGDLHRDSLMPNKYSGVDNIIEKLNLGYNARHIVTGVWQGHGGDIRVSLQHREGAKFIQKAKEEFLSKYSVEYGVVDIIISDIYEG